MRHFRYAGTAWEVETKAVSTQTYFTHTIMMLLNNQALTAASNDIPMD
jgi:hypothetical protein